MKVWFDLARYQYVWGPKGDDCSCEKPILYESTTLTSSFYDPYRSPCHEALSSLPLQQLRLEPDLYIQSYDNNCWLVCHPTGNGQIAVMDTPALTLLQSFQQTKTMHHSSFDELRAIHLFISLGFLRNADEPDIPAGNQQGQTLSAWLHMTNACNLSCHYCYIAKSSEHMADTTSRRAVDAVIRSALKEGYRAIELIYAGGEASLRLPQVFALHDYTVEQTNEHGLTLSASLLSNGVALTKRAIEQIKQRDMSVMISLDGIGRIHDQQRPLLNGQGSFRLVDHTISRLLEQQLIPSINATVSARTIASLPDLIAYLLERDLPFRLSYYRENDCSASRTDLQYSEAQMISGMRAVFSYVEEHLPKRCLLNSLIDKGSMLSQGSHVCGVGRNYLVIDQRGGVAKCHADITKTVTTIEAQNPLAQIRQDHSGVRNCSDMT